MALQYSGLTVGELIGSDDGMSHVRHEDFIWTNDVSLLIKP